LAKRPAHRAFAAITVAALAFPAAAQGTITIGSNLGRTPNIPHLCGSAQCTLVQRTLPAAATAPGGLVSPVNGTVVAWRVRAGGSTGPVSLRVVRQFGDNLFSGVGTSAPVTPPVNTISAFPAQLPIAVWQTIGIDCCSSSATFEVTGTGNSNYVWAPALADGDAGRAPGNDLSYEVAVAAEIEPTSSFSSKVQAMHGGKVKVTVNVRNPGTLTAGDKNARLAAIAGTGTKPKYLKRASAQLTMGGTAGLVVRPTKAARHALSGGGRLKTKLKLVFTPSGGAPSTQVRKVKLKP